MDALDGGVDYMLSGGLNKDNVEEAVAATRAPGVDVSSGVESAPGVKDIGRMEEFFEALRRATGRAVAAGSRM